MLTIRIIMYEYILRALILLVQYLIIFRMFQFIGQLQQMLFA